MAKRNLIKFNNYFIIFDLPGKGWKHSTMGRVLHYIDENGKENFK